MIQKDFSIRQKRHQEALVFVILQTSGDTPFGAFCICGSAKFNRHNFWAFYIYGSTRRHQVHETHLLRAPQIYGSNNCIVKPFPERHLLALMSKKDFMGHCFMRHYMGQILHGSVFQSQIVRTVYIYGSHRFQETQLLGQFISTGKKTLRNTTFWHFTFFDHEDLIHVPF